MHLPRVSPRRLLAVLLALLCAAFAAPAAASAAKVTGPGPWRVDNTYLVRADLDGRTRPKLKPVARVDHVKAGQWIRIQCQTGGEVAYGSKVWIKTGGFYVPDHYVKTYTDGLLANVPTCAPNPGPVPPDPSPTPPYVPAPPSAPTHDNLVVIARAVEFEDVGGSNYGRYKKLYPETRKDVDGHSINWGTNGCSVPENLANAEFSLAGKTGKPIKYYSDLFEKSCDRHDFGYRNFGSKSAGLMAAPTKAGKDSIDSRFRSNMKIQCDERFDRKYLEAVQRGFCKKVADVFYKAVSTFGGKNYYR
ncbi:phospholipase A2 [Patulibacter minatonensis]|uniref:phospholipase A2 n=1 Tax=Patulibacter minatonensis TaxID=298163 RepID=UPI000687D7F0|nr:phospholipase A2 [Patulibacter minatonensis]